MWSKILSAPSSPLRTKRSGEHDALSASKQSFSTKGQSCPPTATAPPLVLSTTSVSSSPSVSAELSTKDTTTHQRTSFVKPALVRRRALRRLDTSLSRCRSHSRRETSFYPPSSSSSSPESQLSPPLTPSSLTSAPSSASTSTVLLQTPAPLKVVRRLFTNHPTFDGHPIEPVDPEPRVGISQRYYYANN